MTGTYKQNMGFEAEVRRVAEAVWNLEPGCCQPTHYANNPIVREVDGIARLRDVTHLIMATTSTRLQKIKDDVKKLNSAEIIERKSVPAVSKWLITEKQIDAEHLEYAKKASVVALTLDQFQRRFFDSMRYISLRSRYAFGSARDPSTDSITIADNAYVELPMQVSYNSRLGKNAQSQAISIQQICQKLETGETIVIRAPFGAGKSLTTREVFNILVKKHLKDSNLQTPICLNLREHWGEDHCDEILERHARAIGYTPREDVVVAWRAGMCYMILDGFDELASQSVVRTDNKNFMRETRRRALQGLRDFTQKLPKGVGVLVCGRDHYFDDEQELINALGLNDRSFSIIEIEEFTEDSARFFLEKNGIDEPLPDWLPRKPLILAYLLRNNLFHTIVEIDAKKGYGYAWDNFLSQICQREAALESSSMEPETIRSVLEYLANSVRAKASGVGPITGNDLADAYTIETGQSAGEGVLAQLQRLPGLTQRDSEPGNRSFIDADMLGALQGGAFAKMALAGFQSSITSPISELSDKAIAMATYVLGLNSTNTDTLIGIAEQLARRSIREKLPPQISGDCLAVAMRMAINEERELLDFRGLTIDGVSLGHLALDEINLTGVNFRNCIITEISLGVRSPNSASFANCMISKLCGASNLDGIPNGMFDTACEIKAYDNMATNSAVLQLDISPQLKALVTILRKLYKQSGTGRKRGALSRGITRPEVSAYIEQVLAVLERHQFISIFNAVVHPVRKQAARVEKILAAPSISNDVLAIDVRSLP